MPNLLKYIKQLTKSFIINGSIKKNKVFTLSSDISYYVSENSGFKEAKIILPPADGTTESTSTTTS